jgi:hypothetical protein
MITAWTLPPRLSNPKTGTLPPAPRPRFALAAAAEIALIDLHLAAKRLRRFPIQALRDHFPQLTEE